MAWFGEFRPYVPVAQRRASGLVAAAAHAKKTGRAAKPVRIEGRKIATTFWGMAWCDHLERFSDYANRLPRGRTYARNGSVVDLHLEPGKVSALVSGSMLYTVEIEVAPLEKPRWKALAGKCAGQIDSVVELLTGELSDGVMTLLCHPQRGLFPSSEQIQMSCSCPDSAELCKHLAAVLYGVGARLDREPELFFVLRGVDKLELINRASKGALASKARRAKEVANDDLADIFGIELDQDPAPKAARAKPKRKSAESRRPR